MNTHFEPFVKPDLMNFNQFESIARSIGRYRVGSLRTSELQVNKIKQEKIPRNILEALNISDVENLVSQNLQNLWKKFLYDDPQFLRIPLGIMLNQVNHAPMGVVYLDLKEPGRGMGPHGIIIGMTGSGKTELLKLIMLALMMKHSPEELTILPLDWKGGAGLVDFKAETGHFVGKVTNLEHSQEKIDKFVSLYLGELVRREALFERHGQKDIIDYQKYRETMMKRNGGKPIDNMPNVPYLIMILDEFPALAAAHPEMMNSLFELTGRKGRSAGMHFILAGQEYDEAKLQKVQPHLWYRIALKVSSAAESRQLIGVVNANYIPSDVSGRGFLKHNVGEDNLHEFRGFYVSDDYRKYSTASVVKMKTRFHQEKTSTEESIKLFAGFNTHSPEEVQVDKEIEISLENKTSEAEMKYPLARMVADSLVGYGNTKKLWTPDLDVPPALNTVLDLLPVEDDKRIAPVGIVDIPTQSRQIVSQIDLDKGNIVVVAGPKLGATTTILTTAFSFAARYSSTDVQFFVIAGGGPQLTKLRNLNHCSGVANIEAQERVRRTIGELVVLAQEREKIFDENDISNMQEYRALRKKDPEKYSDRFGDVILFIDNYKLFKTRYESEHTNLMEYLIDASSKGIYVYITLKAGSELSQQHKAKYSQFFEFHSTDPDVTSIKGRKYIPLIPGRCFSNLYPSMDNINTIIKYDYLHTIFAAPRLDNIEGDSNLSAAVDEAIKEINEKNPVQAPRTRILPTLVSYRDYADKPRKKFTYMIGVNESNAREEFIDARKSSGLICFGDSQMGKTTLVKSIIHDLVDHHRPGELIIYCPDLNKEYVNDIPKEFLVNPRMNYPLNKEIIKAQTIEISKNLDKRKSAETLTIEDLQKNAVQQENSKALIVYIIDDLHILSPRNAISPPIESLYPLLPIATQIGLHVIVTSTIKSANTALSSHHLLKPLNEVNSPLVLLSGDKIDGPIRNIVVEKFNQPGRANFSTVSGHKRIQVAQYLTAEDIE